MAHRSWFRLAALACTLVLAGCSSLGSPSAPRQRAVDYLHDDVAQMVLAFDMPRSLEPMEQGSVLRLNVTAANGVYRHIDATLVRADAGDVVSALPPPEAGRTYYLYGFSEPDRLALRDMQAWARGLPAGYLGTDSLEVTLEPRFCAAEPVDPKSVRFAVLQTLPRAPALEPLIAGRSLADALAPYGGKPVPPCTGHSG